MFRKLFGDATLAFLASHTPAPVETYALPPAPVVPRTGPATVQANGITLEYDTFGDPADPPLLLVMGLAGADGGVGRGVLRADRGARLLTPRRLPPPGALPGPLLGIVRLWFLNEMIVYAAVLAAGFARDYC